MITNCKVWRQCFEGNWKGLIVPKAFQHPAKFSYSLLLRIIQHAKENGWVKQGDLVVDPFGGVGCGGVVCTYRGLKWAGCELEQKFVDLASENFELHRRTWDLGYIQPTILQGDSRNLSRVLKRAKLLVSSPPYADIIRGTNTEKETAQHSVSKRRTPGGSLGQSQRHNGYGLTAGNLSALPMLVVSSPPYWGTGVANAKGGQQTDPKLWNKGIRLNATTQNEQTTQYGISEGQLGQQKDETFWDGSKLVVEQCVKVLVSGGHAIWVCKDFVRDGARINFSDQWQALCEACGLELVCRHQATLVQRTQKNTFAGVKVKEKKFVSFFRRLHEKKGSPKIDWEDVICMRKP